VDLTPIFKARSLAVIGVSLTNNRHPANVIHAKNHLRSRIKVYPVNPRGGRLNGDRVYENISDIASPVDLAVIAVRADLVPQTLADCAKSGVKGAIIISGGFAEAGRSDLQDELVRIAREANLPFIGPNCLGMLAPDYVDTMFLPPERMIRPQRGNVALVSQSGGIIVDQIIKLDAEGVGIAAAVSIGNKAFVREIELLDYLDQREDVGVIVFYLEGFEKGEGRRFVEAAQKASTPVVVIKSGRSEAGGRAVSSHTASLAGDYRTFSSIMSQYGILEPKDELQLVAAVEALSRYNLCIDKNIGIITGSGGHGAMAVDACDQSGLETPQLSEKTRNLILESVSPSIRGIASVSNPVDLTGSAVDEDFVAAAKALIEDDDIHCVMLLLLPYLPGITSDLGARMSYLAQAAQKPMIAYVPLLEKYRMLIEGFELNGVPVSSSIEGAVMMAQALRRSQPCSLWR
jgi:acetyltransferase